jgi:hypothetical protein
MKFQSACRLIVASTPDGLVIRRIFACGEDAWRKAPDGAWDHSTGNKGPWIRSNAIFVPAEVLREVAILHDTGKAIPCHGVCP